MPSLEDELRSEPFHLALSAGYFGIFAHAGFVHALALKRLEARSLSGTSAGALVAALVAAGMPAEEIADELTDLRRRDFWDPGIGLGLLKGRKLERRIAEFSPVARLEDCPRPVAISVFNLRTRRLEVLRRGDLARCVHASLAIAPLFMPVRIDGTLYTDGGHRDRPALAGVAREMRVLAHDLPSRSRRDPAPRLDFRAFHRLRFPSLPSLGPFKLERAPEAIRLAREETWRALGDEVPESTTKEAPGVLGRRPRMS